MELEKELSLKENVYLNFLEEVFDIIQKNYWKELSEKELANIFKEAIEKKIQKPLLPINSKKELKEKIFELIKTKKEKEKKEFVVSLAESVLTVLEPIQRSKLYRKKDERKLGEMVYNINKEVNLYKVLEVKKTDPPQKIEEKYKEKIKKIAKLKGDQAKKELSQLKKAFLVLADPKKREIYDKYGIEPTVFSKKLSKNVLYLAITRISPTTFDEFKREADSWSEDKNLDSFILDLRGDIGGSFDILPYLLGPFIGMNQYAFEILEQGKHIPFKTKTGWLPSLVKYKRVIILIDEKTQSSAELMASVLKKYNVGILLGTRTKGWGTVEKVFKISTQIDLSEKYSIFLVRALTLREDGLPIEGRGVDPLISIRNPNWEKELDIYFRDKKFLETIKKVVANNF